MNKARAEREQALFNNKVWSDLNQTELKGVIKYTRKEIERLSWKQRMLLQREARLKEMQGTALLHLRNFE